MLIQDFRLRFNWAVNQKLHQIMSFFFKERLGLGVGEREAGTHEGITPDLVFFLPLGIRRAIGGGGSNGAMLLGSVDHRTIRSARRRRSGLENQSVLFFYLLVSFYKALYLSACLERNTLSVYIFRRIRLRLGDISIKSSSRCFRRLTKQGSIA